MTVLKLFRREFLALSHYLTWEVLLQSFHRLLDDMFSFLIKSSSLYYATVLKVLI